MELFDLQCLYTSSLKAKPQGAWFLDLPCWLQDEFRLWDGSPVNSWDSELFAFSALNGPRVDLPSTFPPFQIMSPALQSAIEELAPGSIQFLPLRIRSTVGDNIILGYAVANYRHRLNALDRKRTKLHRGELRFKKIDPQGNYAVETPVLDSKKCTEKVFKVQGCSPLHVYREDIVDELVRRELTGLKFLRVES